MYIGYGIRTDDGKWKSNLYSLLYQNISSSDSHIKEMLEEYYKSNQEDYSSMEDSFSDFCDSYYMNDTTLQSGWESVLTEYINEQECPVGEYFIFDDEVIHVPLFIPKDEEARATCPTISWINEILSKYILPLSESERIIDYYTIL